MNPSIFYTDRILCSASMSKGVSREKDE